METTFTTAGVACIIAAVVGGGLKAFAIEIPLIQSRVRQLALAGLGVLLIVIGRLSTAAPTAPVAAPSRLKRAIAGGPSLRHDLTLELIALTYSVERKVVLIGLRVGPARQRGYHAHCARRQTDQREALTTRCGRPLWLQRPSGPAREYRPDDQRRHTRTNNSDWLWCHVRAASVTQSDSARARGQLHIR